MASMCAQVTPLTSCPVLENKTGGRRSGVRRTGKKEREGAVRADPGAEGTVCRGALVRGQKAPEGWPRGAGCPLPQERLGPRGGPGQELVQGQGLRRDENRGQCGRGAHPPAERGAPGRHGHRPASLLYGRDRGGPRLLPAQDPGTAKGPSWDVPGWRSNRRSRLTPRHSLGPRGRTQSQARGPGVTCCAL